MPSELNEAPGGSPEAKSDTDKLLGSLTTAWKLASDDTVVPRYGGIKRFGPGVRKIVNDVVAWLPGPKAVSVTARSEEDAPAVTTKLAFARPLPIVTLFGVSRMVSLAMRLTSKGVFTATVIVTKQFVCSDILRVSDEQVTEET
jgi:hypothetical protein